MTTALIILCSLILLSLIAVLFVLLRGKTEKPALEDAQQLLVSLNDNLRKEIQEMRKDVEKSSGENRKEVQARIDRINEEISSFQKSTTKTLQTQFSDSQKIIKDVTEKLTQIDGTNHKILGFAEQMRSLENILQNPKQRGVLGEYFLETLLGNVLQPNQYQMQYKFSNGDTVDSVIFFQDKIIPIDSKFSLEKYNKMVETTEKSARDLLEREFKGDVKNRIDETAKYIKPAERTTEFAFMFVPAEGIYYNLLIYNVGSVSINTQDLIEYAFKKHVIIVSPSSFYAYLETVLQGLKALKIEESVKEVIKRVGQLSRHLKMHEDQLNRLGKNLGTVVNSYNQTAKEFKKVDKDVLRITNGEDGGAYEAMLLNKPQED